MPRMTATDIKPARLILADKLRRHFEDAGRGSRKQFAEAIGVLPSQVSQYLAGTENIGLNTLDIIADAIGCSVAELLSDEF